MDGWMIMIIGDNIGGVHGSMGTGVRVTMIGDSLANSCMTNGNSWNSCLLYRNMEDVEQVTLRKAAITDIDAVVRIAQIVVPLMNAVGNYQWNDTYPLQTDFEKDIAMNVLWVAVVGDTIAGFAALTCDQSEEYADVGWDLSKPCIVPHRLAVDPAFRGKGVAFKFMLMAEELANQAGYEYVRVDTNVKNNPMQNLFAKLGYEFCGEISFKNKPIIYEKMMFKCYQKKMVDLSPST